jgi:prephenate dehydrogenase
MGSSDVELLFPSLRMAPQGPTTVGIVGLGAVGASIGLALARGRRTLGVDTSAENLQEAVRLGAISRPCRDLSELEGCRTIFVAVPPGSVVEVSRQLLAVTSSTIVDVASVKSQIARSVTSSRFVPSHPLAGTHLGGPGAARADLFAGATWAVCPGLRTSRRRLLATEGLIRSMGAEPLRMEAAEHDSVVASTSHLPHVVASGLVHVLGRHDRGVSRRLVGPGFLDTTRIARANPDLWAEITLRNRSEVGRSIDEIVERLNSFKEAIGNGNRQEVLEYFADATRLLESCLPIARRAAPPATAKVVSFRNARPVPLASELGGAH